MNHKHYALTGIASVLLFMGAYLIISTTRSDFSHATKAISELGSVDVAGKWAWNLFGYILPGALVSLFSVGLYRGVASGRGSKLPLAGIFLSGAFMALAGIFPGDFEHRNSTTMLLHTIGSFGSYVFFLIGAFTYPRVMRITDHWKPAIRPLLILTWLSIIFGTWPFLFPDIPSIGQRLTFLCYFSWIAYAAVVLYRQEPSHDLT